MQACLTVSTFDPTEVPNELATSLAPIPNAKTNAVRKPRTTSHSTSGEQGSSVKRLCGVVCTASMVQSVCLTQTLTILPGPRHSPPYKVFSLTPRPSMACGPQVLLSPATILFISNITALFPSPELAFVKYCRQIYQVPNKYPTIRKYVSSCYKNKLQKNDVTNYSYYSYFSPSLCSVRRLGLAVSRSSACHSAVLINQHLPLYNDVSATITATRSFCRLNTLFRATTSAFHLFLVNNSFCFSLLLYPFFVSKTEHKKGTRDCARCNEVLVNSLPANINAFRPSVAEKWEPRINSCCPLSNTSCEPTETNKRHGYTVHQTMLKPFYYQPMHIMLKNTELLKHSKITLQHVSVYVETIFRELRSVLG